MNKKPSEYEFIETHQQLAEFRDQIRGKQWIGIDTEFVGERRYYTLLCLVQISTDEGLYIIDALNIKNLDPLLEIVADSSILKITHAGENDYRLFYQLFKIIPSNIFDTQIAAGFLGYNYPISFSKLVAKELGKNVKKGYTVSDWESRPINPKQMQYALDDVIYLENLWLGLKGKLEELGRDSWAQEEFAKLETEPYYIKDPNKEALSSALMRGISTKEKVFLMRLYAWRRSEAERKNYSKDMILPNKHISFIVRNIQSGKNAAKVNRRIPNKIVQDYWEEFTRIFNQEITQEEQEVVNKYNAKRELDFDTETTMEMLYLMVKIRCQKLKVSEGLAFSRTIFNKMKESKNYYDPVLESSWRKDLLGELLTDWLKNREGLEVVIEKDQCIIRKAKA